MAGTLLELKVQKGDIISVGQEVAVVESMKMEVPIVSSANGTVSNILKSSGDFLKEDDGILELVEEK